VLRAETFAMLAGALGLWVILGTVMYLTRKIDWYRGGEA
jgi:inner membrane protein